MVILNGEGAKSNQEGIKLNGTPYRAVSGFRDAFRRWAHFESVIRVLPGQK